jgi:hypothetical protein
MPLFNLLMIINDSFENYEKKWNTMNLINIIFMIYLSVDLVADVMLHHLEPWRIIRLSNDPAEQKKNIAGQ